MFRLTFKAALSNSSFLQNYPFWIHKLIYLLLYKFWKRRAWYFLRILLRKFYEFLGGFYSSYFEEIPKWKTLLYLKIYFKESIHNLIKCSRIVEISPNIFFQGLSWSTMAGQVYHVRREDGQLVHPGQLGGIGLHSHQVLLLLVWFLSNNLLHWLYVGYHWLKVKGNHWRFSFSLPNHQFVHILM